MLKSNKRHSRFEFCVQESLLLFFFNLWFEWIWIFLSSSFEKRICFALYIFIMKLFYPLNAFIAISLVSLLSLSQNIDLTQRKMIYEGPLTWRVTKEKAIGNYTFVCALCVQPVRDNLCAACSAMRQKPCVYPSGKTILHTFCVKCYSN